MRRCGDDPSPWIGVAGNDFQQLSEHMGTIRPGKYTGDMKAANAQRQADFV
jgi:hypothetical protein